MTAEVDRFMRYAMPEPNSGCWLWSGALSSHGYGIMSVKHGSVSAHRFSHSHFNGPIPDGYQIDHLCRNRACVNPAHLEAVTPQENLFRVPRVYGRTHANYRRHPKGSRKSSGQMGVHFDQQTADVLEQLSASMRMPRAAVIRMLVRDALVTRGLMEPAA